MLSRDGKGGREGGRQRELLKGDKWTTSDCNSGIHVLNRSESICKLFSHSFFPPCSSYSLSFLFFFYQPIHFSGRLRKATGSSTFFLFMLSLSIFWFSKRSDTILKHLASGQVDLFFLFFKLHISKCMTWSEHVFVSDLPVCLVTRVPVRVWAAVCCRSPFCCPRPCLWDAGRSPGALSAASSPTNKIYCSK